MSNRLTSGIYSNNAIANTIKGKKMVKKTAVKMNKDDLFRQNMIFKVKKAKRELDELLNDLKEQGILEFRVTDACNSTWQSVPENWNEYDLSCEEYRITPS